MLFHATNDPILILKMLFWFNLPITYVGVIV